MTKLRAHVHATSTMREVMSPTTTSFVAFLSHHVRHVADVGDEYTVVLDGLRVVGLFSAPDVFRHLVAKLE